MNYQQFIDAVQARAGLEDREQVVELTRAALGTLGERLYRTERRQFLSPLPPELRRLGNAFENAEPSRRMDQHFTLEEYYNRVSARAHVRRPQAIRGALAVSGALKEALGEPEIRAVLDELPAEYRELFGADPTRPDSPTIAPGH